MTPQDIFSDLPRLETERLILRKLRAEDDEAVFAYASDPEVARYVGWDVHRSIEDSRAYIDVTLESYANGDPASWGIETRDTGTLIGAAGFFNWDLTHARAEFGYSLRRRYWNLGYTTEAALAMIDFGFTTMELNRIEAQCAPSNVASARVMEKAGMSYEGLLRERMFTKGMYRDLKIYSILRSEWEARRR